MARTCSSLTWAAEHALVGIVSNSVMLCLNLANFFLFLMATATVWGGILVAGLVFVATRELFLLSIPVLCEYADILAIWFTMVLIFSYYLWQAVKIILKVVLVIVNFAEEIVEKITDAIDAVGDALGIHFPSVSLPRFDSSGLSAQNAPPDSVSADDIRTELHMILDHCEDIDSTAAIANQWVPTLVGSGFCPYFRALYPLDYNIGPALYDTFGRGWVPDPTPYPLGNNCNQSMFYTPTNNQVGISIVPNENRQYGILCAGLGVGYPTLEVVLPIIFIGIFMITCGAQFWAIVGYAFVFVKRVVWATACWVSKFLHAIEDAASCACSTVEALL